MNSLNIAESVENITWVARKGFGKRGKRKRNDAWKGREGKEIWEKMRK